MTLVEGVQAGLSQMLLSGGLDLAVMAQPESLNERLDALPLYRERCCIGFPVGHRLEQQNRIIRIATSPARLICGGSIARTAIILRTSCASGGWLPASASRAV